MLDAIKTSGLDYRAVLPPHISSEPSSKFVVTFDKPPESRVISKLDLGKFFIECLDNEEYCCKVMGIANVK